MPNISVIISIYNVEKYLAECLDSVLAQTFADFEIICVNDGSTDNSAKILEEYAQKDHRIKIITQENQGVVVARNNAIKCAKEKFIYPLDGDDKIALNCLDELYKTISTTSYRVVASETCVFGKYQGYFLQPKFTKYEMYGIHECCVISALFYKEDFEKFGGYKLAFNNYGGDDMDYWLNYIDNDMPMIRLPRILFFYRAKENKESLWKNYSKEEMKKRTLYKENMLFKYHPKMKKYTIIKKIINFIFQIKHKPNEIKIRLFCLPIIKIKDRYKFYLLGFLPFLRIRTKYDKKTFKLFNIISFFSINIRNDDTIYKLLELPVFYTQRKKNLLSRYNEHIANIKYKEKISVGFLVRENSKWSYDSVYIKLSSDIRFKPIVLIVAETGDDSSLCNIENNIHFFNKYNYQIVRNINDIINININILFYEQPWFDLKGDFTPYNVSKYALTMYVPYVLESDFHQTLFDKTDNFYKTLFVNFAFNDKIKNEYLNHGIANLHVTGHPRLDAYAIDRKNKNLDKTNKIRIIYAPHHSFEKSLLKWGSWEWSGNHILDLSRKHQDTTEWFFKPHPRFKLELEKLLDSKQKAQKVFDDWAEVSTLCNTGDYFDLFKSTDLMISDCGSFKIEWLPTKKPFIHLLSHYKDMQPYGKNTDYYSSAYYKADSIDDIDKYFDMLITQHNDPLADKRKKLSGEIQLGASDKIYNFIKELLE